MWIECSKCGQHKALWAFNKDKSNKNLGHAYWCIECGKKNSREFQIKLDGYQKTNPKVLRESDPEIQANLNYNSMKDIGKNYKYCLRCGASIWSEKEFLDEKRARYQDTLLCVNCLTEHVDKFYKENNTSKKIPRYKRLINNRKRKTYIDIQEFLAGEGDNLYG